MLILLALIAAATAGIAIHYTLPHRSTRGVVLAPALAASTAGVAYTALQWAGQDESSVWLWVVSIGVPIAVTYIVVGALSRSRLAHDERERVRLKIA